MLRLQPFGIALGRASHSFTQQDGPCLQVPDIASIEGHLRDMPQALKIHKLKRMKASHRLMTYAVRPVASLPAPQPEGGVRWLLCAAGLDMCQVETGLHAVSPLLAGLKLQSSLVQEHHWRLASPDMTGHAGGLLGHCSGRGLTSLVEGVSSCARFKQPAISPLHTPEVSRACEHDRAWHGLQDAPVGSWDANSAILATVKGMIRSCCP